MRCWGRPCTAGARSPSAPPHPHPPLALRILRRGRRPWRGCRPGPNAYRCGAAALARRRQSGIAPPRARRQPRSGGRRSAPLPDRAAAGAAGRALESGWLAAAAAAAGSASPPPGRSRGGEGRGRGMGEIEEEAAARTARSRAASPGCGPATSHGRGSSPNQLQWQALGAISERSRRPLPRTLTSWPVGGRETDRAAGMPHRARRSPIARCRAAANAGQGRPRAAAGDGGGRGPRAAAEPGPRLRKATGP